MKLQKRARLQRKGKQSKTEITTSGRGDPKTDLQLPLIAVGAAKDNKTVFFENLKRESGLYKLCPTNLIYNHM